MDVRGSEPPVPPSSPVLDACDEQHAVAVTDGWLTVAEPEVAFRPARPPVHGPGSTWDVLESRLPDVLPATRVVGLPGALVVGPNGWVVTPDDRVVVPLSWYESDGTPSIRSITWTSERRIPGTALNLATVNGATNYGHFLLDGLGRLAVAEQVGLRPADVDWVVVPAFDSAGAREIVRRLGISPDKIVHGGRGVALRPDVVVTPSLPGTTRTYRPVVADYLRRFVEPVSPGGDRIMISRRGGRRAMTNAEDVESLAARHGCRVVRPEDVDLPAEVAAASLVVGAHGAALADLAFGRPGTQVIEIIPSDHMFPYWFSLAAAAGMDYRAVIGDSAAVRPPDEWGSSREDVTVRLDLLDEALSAVGSGPA